ncbi:hypothetical protein [Alkalihalobacillus sp. AL-G]|uniref:hypothetical protein n=1 Tax=Alkalihalobacillus sp. AL-G TaxID=2926399 RepID=UPI00272C1E26|nr:hypothetical protein [Alkalihalobacillus sp. AL-G]WLD92723.1 hypothetical protein MOJ78_17185 [Alkalihalobacillus sp. AL-G]
MRIHQLIELFSAHYHGCTYLSPFFRLKDYYVSINDNHESVTVHLCKRSCQVVHTEDVNEEVIQISGSYASIQMLLCGDARLSQLVKEKRINVTAPYRIQLKLESIFHLASEQSRNAV